MSAQLATTEVGQGVLGIRSNPLLASSMADGSPAISRQSPAYWRASWSTAGVFGEDTHEAALTSEEGEKLPTNILRIETPQERSGELIPLHKWEGTVLFIDGSLITARVESLTEQAEPHQIDIDVEEVSEDDRELLAPGAMFYWTIGYKIEPSGQRQRISQIRMKRKPVWSREELARADETAAEWATLCAQGLD